MKYLGTILGGIWAVVWLVIFGAVMLTALPQMVVLNLLMKVAPKAGKLV